VRQHHEDESFYVLEGEYDFLVEDRTLRVVAGSLLYVPKGTLHAHESVGAGVGRICCKLRHPAARTSASLRGRYAIGRS
jgi:mannose-6-phosphate isomerase-like protein (cupin superfamily)